MRDVVSRELELAERARALAERIDRLEVRAPASGLVLGLTITTPQSVIRPAETLMVIVPQDRPLLAAARVPVTHVDEVRPGQSVRLVFHTLPTRNTPEVSGKVTLVSADALTDERTGLPYYRAEITIDAQSLDALVGAGIVPGMPVDAFLRTQDRTPLSYLVKPFTDYFRARLPRDMRHRGPAGCGRRFAGRSAAGPEIESSQGRFFGIRSATVFVISRFSALRQSNAAKELCSCLDMRRRLAVPGRSD